MYPSRRVSRAQFPGRLKLLLALSIAFAVGTPFLSQAAASSPGEEGGERSEASRKARAKKVGLLSTASWEQIEAQEADIARFKRARRLGASSEATDAELDQLEAQNAYKEKVRRYQLRQDIPAADLALFEIDDRLEEKRSELRSKRRLLYEKVTEPKGLDPQAVCEAAAELRATHAELTKAIDTLFRGASLIPTDASPQSAKQYWKKFEQKRRRRARRNRLPPRASWTEIVRTEDDAIRMRMAVAVDLPPTALWSEIYRLPPPRRRGDPYYKLSHEIAGFAADMPPDGPAETAAEDFRRRLVETWGLGAEIDEQQLDERRAEFACKIGLPETATWGHLDTFLESARRAIDGPVATWVELEREVPRRFESEGILWDDPSEECTILKQVRFLLQEKRSRARIVGIPAKRATWQEIEREFHRDRSELGLPEKTTFSELQETISSLAEGIGINVKSLKSVKRHTNELRALLKLDPNASITEVAQQFKATLKQLHLPPQTSLNSLKQRLRPPKKRF